MRETVSVLHLKPSQAGQLLASCAAYRSYLWQCVCPAPERNQTLRRLQALQGRLEKAQEQGQAQIALVLNREEKHALQQLLSGLTRLYGTAPSSEQRVQTLGELAGLRVLVERASRQGQAF